MKFGTLYSYWGNEWKCDYGETMLKAAEAGFDILEVGAGHLLEMSDGQLEELRASAEGCGLKLTANIGPARDKDVASADPGIRKEGIRYLREIMKAMDRIGCRRIVGVMYSHWPYDFEDLDKEAVWDRGVMSVKELGKTAQELNIEMCLEVVNRFESIVLNTAQEGVRFCRDVDMPAVRLLLDTFHMNIEEDSIPEAILAAAEILGELHVGEGNRKLPGKGSLPWKEIGGALKEISFAGDVVMEPFVLPGGQVGKDIKLWRDLSGGAGEKELSAELAGSLRYLRNAFA